MSLFKRRRIGPAYERCPAEKIKDWGTRNLLALVGSSIAAFVFIVIVHGIVILLNWINENASADGIESFDNTSVVTLTIKFLGAMITFIIVALTTSQ